jgi:hypothetical protein
LVSIDYELGSALALLIGMFRTLRPLDLACIGIITMAASTGVSAWLGLSDTASIIALTMGLTCPAARRLIAWRRGAQPTRFEGSLSARAFVVFAMLPWIVLPGLRLMPWQAVASLATMRVELPEVVRWAGVALTIAGVLRPMAATLRGTGRIRSAAYVETVGLFLATGNVFLGTLAASWLLVQTFGPQRAAADAVPAPAIVAAA